MSSLFAQAKPATPASPTTQAKTAASAPAAQWKSSTKFFTESTAIEVRFPVAMISDIEVGQSSSQVNGSAGPVQVEPPIEGQWIWRSRTSGVFIPQAMPLPSQTYRFRLIEGLRDFTGSRLTLASADYSVRTASLAMLEHHPRWISQSDTAREPHLLVQMSQALDPESIKKAASFVSADGQSVGAQIRFATYADVTEPSQYFSSTLVQKALNLAQRPGEKINLQPELVLPGTLSIKTTSALPVGPGWTLQLKGLKTAVGQKSLDETISISLGEVQPLRLLAIEVLNEVSTPKALIMRFNKKLPADTTEQEVIKHVRIEPAVEEQKITYNAESQNVQITGKFSHDLNYSVIVTPGLKSEGGLSFSSEEGKLARFMMITPVVALPAFSHNQMAQGRQNIDLQTVNLANYKVQVKAADRDSLIYALKAYQGYMEGVAEEETPDQNTDHDPLNPKYEEATSYQTRVPYELMPGQTIYEQNEAVTTPLDQLNQLTLDWKKALGDKKVGALFLNVEGDARPEWPGKKRRFGAQAFIQITDIGLAWKWSAGEIMVWAFSQQSGQPLTGVALTCYDAEKRALANAVTDANGLARLERKAGSAWIMAESAQDLHAISVKEEDREGLGLWRFGVNYSWLQPKAWQRTVRLFTDRPVYQPNDTVYFKACSRWLDATGELQKPKTAEKATLKVYDAKSRVMHERELTFSANGTTDGLIALNASTLGYSRITLSFPEIEPKAKPVTTAPEEEESENEEASDRVFETAFLVEEYKPNTFAITFPEQSFSLQGEKAKLELQARYLLGKPLSKADLKWSARVSRANFDAQDMDDYLFLDTREMYFWDEAGRHEVPVSTVDQNLVTAQAEVALSDRGLAALDFTVPAEPFTHRPREILIEAEVTDINQQTLSQSWKKVLPSSDFYLGIAREAQMTSVEKNVPIRLIAAKNDGTPYEQNIEAKVKVEKIIFSENRIQTVGGGSNVKVDAQRSTVAEGTLNVRPKGQMTEPFVWTPKEPGFYYITTTATDAQGRSVESITSHQVSGTGWATWESEDGVKIDLTSDKSTYLPGETAKILVKSPVLGKAMVTVERAKVMKSFLVDITNNAQVVEVPLEAGWAPNAFISVFIVRGAQSSPRQHPVVDYKVGFCDISIEDQSTRLAVKVSTNQPTYRPGDEGTAEVTITDQSGKVIPEAEVTLWAADDGVLTLVDYQMPDLWTHFYAPRVLSVSTGTTLMNLLPEDPKELAFSNKGYVIGGGSEGRSRSQDMQKRENFRPLAFWAGALKTNAQGQASTRFRVPDNLTRFRVMAVAMADRGTFGQSETSFEINKPLMVEPALPRIAHVGDDIVAKAIVLNNTEAAFDAEVTLRLDALATSTGELKKKISLSAHESVAVSFPLKIADAGQAQWTWTVSSLSPSVTHADQVASTLTLDYSQPKLREWHYASHQPGAEAVNLLSAVNPELLEGSGQLTLTVSNSILLEAEGAMKALLQYPYGCAEQTTSSTVPWLVQHQLEASGLSSGQSAERRQAAIQAGAQRLLSMQTTQGGLAYWPGGHHATRWASCYGGMGLVLCRQAGAVVPQERLDSLATYLSTALRQTANMQQPDELFEQAFACYTLSLMGKGEPAYHELLRQKIDLVPHSGRALLALAIEKSGGTPAQMIEVLDAPLAPGLEKNTHGVFGSRLTGMNLFVWAKIDPHHLITTKLTERLLQERRPDGAWLSTFDNSWSLLALGTLAEKQKDNLVAQEIEITHAGQTQKISLPAKPSTQSINLKISGQPTEKELTMTGLKAGLRSSLLVEARPKLMTVAPRVVALGVTRRYQKVSPTGALSDIDSLEVGDRVAVTLEVKVPEKTSYVVVDDALPAIFEAINPKFVSQASNPTSPVSGQPTLLPWWSSHTELRKDRALFFADEIWSPGTYQISYLARVIAEGNVTAPSAKVEAMYDPESYGLSGSQPLSAKASAEVVEKK
jgi:alpha-2-macroglobulin